MVVCRTRLCISTWMASCSAIKEAKASRWLTTAISLRATPTDFGVVVPNAHLSASRVLRSAPSSICTCVKSGPPCASTIFAGQFSHWSNTPLFG